MFEGHRTRSTCRLPKWRLWSADYWPETNRLDFSWSGTNFGPSLPLSTLLNSRDQMKRCMHKLSKSSYYCLAPLHFRTLRPAICYIVKQESVRPRWPYDMRPSVRAEKYIRDASGWRKDVTDGNDNGTDGQTDRQTDGQSATQYAAPS